jgi:hypothetical protein
MSIHLLFFIWVALQERRTHKKEKALKAPSLPLVQMQNQP